MVCSRFRLLLSVVLCSVVLGWCSSLLVSVLVKKVSVLFGDLLCVSMLCVFFSILL